MRIVRTIGVRYYIFDLISVKILYSLKNLISNVNIMPKMIKSVVILI